MKTLTAKAASVLALSAIFSTASAASFDFVAMADDNSDDNYFGEMGFAELDVTVDGVNLKATGTDTADYLNYLLGDYDGGLNNESAYLDSGTAGLGVCTVLTNSDQCNPSSDDNATADEVLNIVFDQEVILADLFFRDANHNTYGDTDDDFSLFIDGVFEGIFEYGSPITQIFKGTMFGFSADDYDVLTNTFSSDGDEFYISSLETIPGGREIPVPAAVWLLGSALGALGFTRRKQVKK